MKKEEFIALANKYKLGLCTQEEKVLYEKIYRELLQEETLAPEWDQKVKEQKREKIRSQIEFKLLEKKTKTIHFRRKIWQWAASVLLVVSVGLLSYFAENQNNEIIKITKSTTSKQRSSLTLEDGSVVVLNSNSQLSYPEEFSLTSREISLRGEAFFDVSRDPGRPFIVRSDEVEITVLGTSFNVRAYGEDRIEVTVSSGEVKVAAPEKGKEVLLLKGQQAVFLKSTGEITRNNVDPEWYVSWINRSLEFDMIPFSDVVTILERTYNTEFKIRGKGSNNCLIRGKYKDESLINVLEGLKLVVDFDYFINEFGTIVIDGKGCVN